MAGRRKQARIVQAKAEVKCPHCDSPGLTYNTTYTAQDVDVEAKRIVLVADEDTKEGLFCPSCLTTVTIPTGYDLIFQ